jgi:hypothetical protein
LPKNTSETAIITLSGLVDLLQLQERDVFTMTALQSKHAQNVLYDLFIVTKTGMLCESFPVLSKLTNYNSRMGRHFSDLKHKMNNKSSGQKTTIARKVFRNEVLETGIGTSDSSAGEEDARDASAAPVPDADIMYSYDATHGPGRGTDVLSNAVTKAVQHYEVKVTEKLAKEYEFVDNGKELADGYAADADEDDFEMIDHINLE